MKNKFTVLVVLLIIASVPIISFVKADREFSDMELRNLKQYPKTQANEVLNGQYFKELESYYLDQMFLRDQSINLKNKFENVLNVKIRNDLFISEDNMILAYPGLQSAEDFIESKQDRLKEASANIVKIAQENPNTELIYLNVPDKELVYDSYFPIRSLSRLKLEKEYNNQFYDMLRTENNINIVDSLDELTANSDNYLYYKADHHFSLEGASIVYSQLLDFLESKYGEDLSYVGWDSLEKITIDKPFIGSYARRIGDSSYFEVDKQIITTTNHYPEFIRLENGEVSEIPLFVNNEIQNYGAFMGGDKANTVINTQRSNLPNVLFIGDSFTNALEYLAVQSFNEIHSIDTRHYKESIYDYINQNNFDYIIIVREGLMTNDFVH